MADRTDTANTMVRLLEVLSRGVLEYQGLSYVLELRAGQAGAPKNWAAQLLDYRSRPANQLRASRRLDAVREAIQRGESNDAILPILVEALEDIFPPYPSSKGKAQ